MSKLIVEMEMPSNCFDCILHCDVSSVDGNGYCRGIPPYMDCDCRPSGETRPSWCPIGGVLPDEHGDLIDRHKTAEELNEMADAVYNDFPLVDRETLVSWDHGIRMAAQYVLNLAGKKDEAVIAAERKDDDKS